MAPTISRFYGIRIYINFREHNPPHFHAAYGDFEAAFDMTGTLMAGALPANATRLVSLWAAQHTAELTDNWNRAQSGRELVNIIPLDA